MENKPRVFLDLDGVIVNFAQGVIDLYKLSCKFEDLTHWGAILEYSGKTPAEFWGGLTEDFWYGLRMFPEAKMLLDLLKPYNPCILTSPSYISAGARQQWIRLWMSDYFQDGRYLIGPAKKYVAREGALLIDDSPDNITAWRKAGGEGFLFPRPWNNSRDWDLALTMQLLYGVLKRLSNED